MKSSIKLSTKVLTTATALGFSSVIAIAAPVPGWVNGDLYLGFRASGSPGADQAYLVKLGNDSTSFSSSGALLLGNLNADLSASENYGASWNTRTDLYWGIFGVRDPVGDPVLYISRQRPTASTPASAWPELSLIRRQATASVVNTVLRSASGIPSGYVGLQATPNSTVAGFQIDDGNEIKPTASYKYQVTRVTSIPNYFPVPSATSGPNDFGSTSGWSNIEGNFSAGAAGTVLDVFRISSTGVSLFGTFSITGAGTITFTKPPVAPVDNDGDGFTNIEEALAGTSDSDGSDFFRIAVTKGPGSTSVNFNSISARVYQIYYSQNLVSNSWELIASVSAGPYADNDPTRNARPRGFYKVGITTP